MNLRHAVFTAVLTCAPGLTLAGQVSFVSDAQPAEALPIAIYEDAVSPASVPVATAVVGEPLDLPAGRYRYGFDVYPWRSDPFRIDDDDPHDIQLRSFTIRAPESAAGDFAVFEGQRGSLVAQVAAGGSLLLPPGNYVLRRDLSDVVENFPVGRSGALLDMGAFEITGETGGEPFAVAQTETGQIAAVATLGQPVALMPGRYLVASVETIGPLPIEIAAGQTRRVPGTRVLWSDAMPNGPVLHLGAGNHETALSGRSGAVQLFGAKTVRVRLGESDWIDVPNANGAAPGLLWRLPDGTLANLDGLPLTLAEPAADRVPPGLPVRLRTSLADTADVAISLLQDDAAFELGTLRLGAGRSEFDVTLPSDLAPGTPVAFRIRLVAAPDIEGVSPEYKVHEPLSVPVSDLSVVETTATSALLSWVIPDRNQTRGVRIFRGSEGNPVTGSEPFGGEGFNDIGLSANRIYKYRVCLVDQLLLPGPCAEVAARTQRP